MAVVDAKFREWIAEFKKANPSAADSRAILDTAQYAFAAGRAAQRGHDAALRAAPELLEALTVAVAAIDKGGLDDVMCCNGWECGCRAATNGELLIHDLRVVIAKATGGAA